MFIHLIFSHPQHFGFILVKVFIVLVPEVDLFMMISLREETTVMQRVENLGLSCVCTRVFRFQHKSDISVQY